MQSKIDEIKKLAEEKISKIKNSQDLQELKVQFLGKKSELSNLLKGLGALTAEERPKVGALVNEARKEIEEKLSIAEEQIKSKMLEEKIEKETIDITLPATKIQRGSKHPVNRVIEEIEDLFVSMGYDVISGPELETDEFCFERLNLPKGHPARDMQDTFYIDENTLMRTHTSPVQAHTLLAAKGKGPIKVICPGKTYRRDDDDATHSHQFMQCEGLVVDKNITLADLKGTLEVFARKFFGEKREIRLRPSYFPFTEPSVEVDISCHHCGGKGCAMCKGTGWIEILGAGMVNPKVLDMCGFDSKEYQGFAFGIGIERVAMLKYGIDNIRDFYNDDLRFLNQFQREE